MTVEQKTAPTIGEAVIENPEEPSIQGFSSFLYARFQGEFEGGDGEPGSEKILVKFKKYSAVSGCQPTHS